MEVDVVELGRRGLPDLGDSRWRPSACEAAAMGRAHAVIRPERVGWRRTDRTATTGFRHGRAAWCSWAPRRRSCCGWRPGVPLQALIQNDGERPDLTQGTPVHVTWRRTRCGCWAGRRGGPGPEDEPLVAKLARLQRVGHTRLPEGGKGAERGAGGTLQVMRAAS